MYICKEVPDDFFENAKPYIGVREGNGSGIGPISPFSPALLPAVAEGFSWDTASIIKAMIFITITVCTIGGNGLVLLAVILRRNTLKSSTHYFIASLSLADFLVGVLVMPFLAALSVTGKWYFGKGYCIAFHCIHYWLCSASILSITAICIERYIGVRYPLKHFKFMNGQRVAQGCGVVWILAGVLSIAPLFIWPEDEEKYTEQACPINFQVGHVVAVMVFMFYIPCAIMLGFYFRIYWIASAHLDAVSARRQKTHGATSSSDSGLGKKGNSKELSTGSTQVTSNITNNASMSDCNSDSWEMVDASKTKPIAAGPEENALKANRQKQASLSKKLFLVVGAFIFCYFPFFTTFMVRAIGERGGYPEIVPDQLFVALGWIRYFNSCLNPMIYAFMLQPFRMAFRDIFAMIGFRSK